MNTSTEIQFDFNTYIARLMEAMEISNEDPEPYTSIQKNLEIQLTNIITSTIAANLNEKSWKQLRIELENGPLEKLYQRAIEIQPNLTESLATELDAFFDETLATYDSLSI